VRHAQVRAKLAHQIGEPQIAGEEARRSTQDRLLYS
jgi:hypothetical protein